MFRIFAVFVIDDSCVKEHFDVLTYLGVLHPAVVGTLLELAWIELVPVMRIAVRIFGDCRIFVEDLLFHK